MRIGIVWTIIAFLANLILATSPTLADDWDNFFSKYGNKAFVVTWKDQWTNPDGKVTYNWSHEFGYAMPSATQIREFTRNTNLLTNSDPVARWDETIRKGDYRNNGRDFYNTYDIDQNKILVSQFWKITTSGIASTLRDTLVISVTSGGCNARFEEADMRLKGWKYERHEIKCVVVNK